MIKHLISVCLDMFDGAASATASGDASGTADGAQGDSKASATGSTRRGRSGEFANVRFGTQPEEDSTPAAGEKKQTDVSVTSNTLDERRAAYSQFLKDNKDLDDERQQQLFNRRFKDYKSLQDSVSKSQPVIDMLMQRYKIADGDIAKLTAAIEGDDEYWADAAEDAGMTIEQYKKFQKLQRENEALVKEQRSRMGQEQAEMQLRRWQTDADALKAKFPAFDLSTEIADPQFKSLLKAGVPMEQAYKVIHMDSMMSDAVGNASAEALSSSTRFCITKA